MVTKVILNRLVLTFYILIFCLFMEHYVLKVNRKRIFYCDRKLKYGSSVSEVKDVERSGKKIDVILENEMRLPIYDIEEKRNM